MILCTLFDSNYLDKGMALYESLEKVTSKFTLYIFAFDKKSEDVLKDMNYKYAKIVSYDELEAKYLILKKLKKERTRAEFCWTCSSLIIEYVLKEYNERSCTYIDADMYFFGNPNILYKEIIDSKGVVGIAPHRFRRDATYRKNVNLQGKYCVHFNTFFYCSESLNILKNWKEQCLKMCSEKAVGGTFGDQLYLNEWPQKYKNVHELMHQGGGVAPWNVCNYDNIEKKKNKIIIREKKEYFPLIFYHFEALKYISNHKIYMNIWEYNKKNIEEYKIFDLYRYKIIYLIYKPYIKHIEKIRKVLKVKYNIGFEHLILDEQEAKKYQSNMKEDFILFLMRKRNVITY